MNKVIFRNANKEDLVEISNIESMVFTPLEAASLIEFKERFKIYKENFFVLEKDLKIIGFIQGPTINDIVIKDDMYKNPVHNIKNKYLSVFGIALKEEYQGKGYGKILLNNYISYAKKMNYKGVILASRVSKVRFYEHLGFDILGHSKSTHGNTVWIDMIYRIKD